MKIETRIREYTGADKFECIEAFRSNVPDYFTPNEIEDFELFLKKLESGDDNASFFVIDHNEKIIGCGGFGDKDNTGVISLAWGLIHKDFHKMGFGEKLLLFRIDRIRQRKPKFPVIIDTTQYSFGFFEKYGFQTVKITDNYYSPGMHRYDMKLII